MMKRLLLSFLSLLSFSQDVTASDTDMWLIVGLGNPGTKYEKNRHNIGFMAVDRIAEDHGFSQYREKFHGLLSEGMIAGSKVLLLKPSTYMNNSGQSVAAAVKFYKIPLDRVLVFYDELDLDPGKIRIKQGGGAAGHNGIKSLDAHLSGKDYWRVRLGIGHPGQRDKVSGYVLHDFPKMDDLWLGPLLEGISKHISLAVNDDMSGYMSKVALSLQPLSEDKIKE